MQNCNFHLQPFRDPTQSLDIYFKLWFDMDRSEKINVKYAYLDNAFIFQGSGFIILSKRLWDLYILIEYSLRTFYDITVISHTFFSILLVLSFFCFF